jgi:hypothetical protein
MKKLLMTLVMAFAFVCFAQAQTTEAPKKAATSFTWSKEALTEIGCDAAQIKQIASLRKESATKLKALKADSTLADADRKAAGKKLSKERTDALMAVLTAEQKAKVLEINKKLKAEAKSAKEN